MQPTLGFPSSLSSHFQCTRRVLPAFSICPPVSLSFPYQARANTRRVLPACAATLQHVLPLQPLLSPLQPLLAPLQPCCCRYSQCCCRYSQCSCRYNPDSAAAALAAATIVLLMPLQPCCCRYSPAATATAPAVTATTPASAATTLLTLQLLLSPLQPLLASLQPYCCSYSPAAAAATAPAAAATALAAAATALLLLLLQLCYCRYSRAAAAMAPAVAATAPASTAACLAHLLPCVLLMPACAALPCPSIATIAALDPLLLTPAAHHGLSGGIGRTALPTHSGRSTTLSHSLPHYSSLSPTTWPLRQRRPLLGEVQQLVEDASVGTSTLSPQQLREWVSQRRVPGGVEAASLSACEPDSTGAPPAEALHTFTLDSDSSRCFFRDYTTATPLTAPIPVTLADPSGGPVVARASTVLPCPAAPSSSLKGLHLPSFATNLVSNNWPLPLLMEVSLWRSDNERYFLLVVDNYTRYTTVFPLQNKADVHGVLIPWIRTIRCQLGARFQQGLQVCLMLTRSPWLSLWRSPLITLAQLRGGDHIADSTVTTRRSPRLETPPRFPSWTASPPLQPAGVDSGAVKGGEIGGADSGGAGSRGAESGGACSGGVERPCINGVVGAPAGGSGGGQQQQSRRQEPLSPRQFRECLVRQGCSGDDTGGAGAGAGASSAGGTGAVGAGGGGAGGAGAGGAGAGGAGGTAKQRPFFLPQA
ncbi:unnamed protein product [Closterium sp. NIES-54]